MTYKKQPLIAICRTCKMEFSTLNEHQEFCDAICGEHFLKKEIEFEKKLEVAKKGYK